MESLEEVKSRVERWRLALVSPAKNGGLGSCYQRVPLRNLNSECVTLRCAIRRGTLNPIKLETWRVLYGVRLHAHRVNG